MAAEWYYSNGSDRLGPVTASELRELAAQGQIQPTSLIWKQGMGDWIAASKVKDITFAIVSNAAPPPLPTSSGAPSAIPTASGSLPIVSGPPVIASPSKRGMSILAWP